MITQLTLQTITVPRDSDRVEIGCDAGVPGVQAVFSLSWQAAKQFAADIDGAAERARRNSQGSQHNHIILPTTHYEVNHG